MRAATGNSTEAQPPHQPVHAAYIHHIPLSPSHYVKNNNEGFREAQSIKYSSRLNTVVVKRLNLERKS